MTVPQLPIERTVKTDQTGRVDAQADLSLHWVHRSVCWFCHEAAQILYDGIIVLCSGLKLMPEIK